MNDGLYKSGQSVRILDYYFCFVVATGNKLHDVEAVYDPRYDP